MSLMQRLAKRLHAKPAQAGSADLQAAIDGYNADHAQEWGHAGGTCPICGHHGCFGRAGGKLSAGRWACFSANHGDVGRKLGACHYGDALDVDAHRAGRARIEHLRLMGYLKQPATTYQRPPKRAAHVTLTVGTSANTLGASIASDLRDYYADFLRERRAVLVVDGGLSPRQANAEARRLLGLIQAREEGTRHAR